MGENRRGSLEREGMAALTLMSQALQLLDTFEQSVEAGAHLDLAISRLRDALKTAGVALPEQNLPPFA